MRRNSTAAKPYKKGRRVWVQELCGKVECSLTGAWRWEAFCNRNKYRREYRVVIGTGGRDSRIWITDFAARRGMRGFRS
jgi:hypothetical protein